MAKRKRRAGAGRPTIGPVAKMATLTARLEPSTRRALNKAAAAHRPKLSVSRMAEHLLKAALSAPPGEPRNRGLACTVALLAQNIEQATGRSWREDHFTAEALLRAFLYLIAYFGPPKFEKPIPVPPAVEAHAAKMPTDSAERFRDPKGFAEVLAFHLMTEIKDALPSEINEWTMPIFFSASRESLGLIAHDLGVVVSKKGKAK